MELFFDKKKILTITIFVFILLFGLIERQSFLYKTISLENKINEVPLNPFLQNDSNAFYNYATLLPYPCYTISRPPFFLMYTKTILKIFGQKNTYSLDYLKINKDKLDKNKYKEELNKIFLNHTLLRQSSIFLSLLAITVMFIFVLRFYGCISALICSLLWATNFSSIFYSVLYVRVDMMAIFNLLALFLFCLLIISDKHKKIYTLLIIIILSLASLTRLSAVSTSLLALILYNFVKILCKKWNIKDLYHGLIIITGVIILLSPYLIHNYIQTGNPAPVMDHHAKFWRNQEFAGKPGYPTVKEVAENPYCGSECSSFEYLFREHSFFGAIWQYVKGYYYAFIYYLPKMFTFQLYGKSVDLWWLLIFSLPGIIYCIRKEEVGIMTLFFAFIVLFPFAFILPLNEIYSSDPLKNVIGVEPRFNMSILPYIFMLTALGVISSGKLMLKILNKIVYR